MPSVISYLPPFAAPFPDISEALTDPNGLLAIGGDLSVKRLLDAYHSGIFPWFMANEPIMWWSPDPRGVLFLSDLYINRSLAKFLRKKPYTLSVNKAFPQVIQACADSHRQNQGTWISQAMITAYTRLHQLGHAHSVEVWQNDTLVGGLYGVMVGGCFCGESMFHYQPNAAKVAYCGLVSWLKQHHCHFIDCQMQNDFLITLGVTEIPRDLYLSLLSKAQTFKAPKNLWAAQTIQL